MCQECGFITGHANVCPNNPDIYEPILAECELCGKEFDEIDLTFGICEKCSEEAHTFDNAVYYGYQEKANISVNGLYAKTFSQDEIDAVLFLHLMKQCDKEPTKIHKYAMEFMTDDDGAFAQWLKGEKND